jgi:hypothetical protein
MQTVVAIKKWRLPHGFSLWNRGFKKVLGFSQEHI